MEKSKVFFTDFRVNYEESLVNKLQRLAKAAGIGDIDMDKRFVAIKMHFGELGNLSFLRPNYARAIVDLVKQAGGVPYLTDCNTLYPGSRKNAIEHMECAWQNGFTPMTVDCPIIIGDGLKGTDDIAVKVEGGEYVKEAKIGRAVMDADIFISLTHFKGHEAAGFGGAVKNIGMGCGSRAGKMEQHCNGQPTISEKRCRGCRLCERECANNGLVFDSEKRKMRIDTASCLGCGRCVGACNFDAIRVREDAAVSDLNCRMAEYAKAVVSGRPSFHISIVRDISPKCDCRSCNDAPILPDVGMFASFDPVALDQACVDACLKNSPLPNSFLSDNMLRDDFVDYKDHFINAHPDSEYRTCLAHGEKIGLGTREYELINVK